MNDRAAFIGLRDAFDFDSALSLIDFHFGASCYKRTLLGAACQADAELRSLLFDPLFPVKFPSGSLEHGAQSASFQVREAKFQRVGTGCRGKFVDEAFFGEMIGGRSECSVRAMSQRGLRSDVLD